jgi:uncharacterized protein
MSTRNIPWEPGTPCWVDLGTPDRDAAAAFYSGLFGWEMTDHGPDMGNYLTASVGEHAVAGIAPLPEDMRQLPAVWTTYLATEDLDATMELAAGAGGTTVMAAMDVPELGRSGLMTDPTGASFGLWQSRRHTGMQLTNEPGAVTWNECMSRDLEAAKQFYATVFDYGWFDMSGDGFRYEAMMVDGRSVAGLGALGDSVPAEVTSHWATYFKVSDAMASAAKVVDLGGTVLREPWDTPFGTMCTVADVSGAAFSVMADNEQSIAAAAAQNG